VADDKELKELKEKVAKLEKELKEFKDKALTLLKKHGAYIERLTKKYPTIINHSSGDGNPVPRNQPLQVSVNSNVPSNNLYEVAITDESGNVQNGCSGPVTFNGGVNPGTATIPVAQLAGLNPNTDYVLVCRSSPGGSNPVVIQHMVDMVTGA
jgi:hypothetical protein